MGQYYKIVNLDKKEYLHPHAFGDGLKLLEFGMSSRGTMTGLTILLADGNNRGGGDLRVDESNPICRDFVGRWAGDRIVIAGDYADKGRFISDKDDLTELEDDDGKPATAKDVNLYVLAAEKFRDVSPETLYCILQDGYILKEIKGELKKGDGVFSNRELLKDIILLIDTKDPKDFPAILPDLTTDGGKQIWEVLVKGTVRKSRTRSPSGSRV
jgi:hypothetical protein